MRIASHSRCSAASDWQPPCAANSVRNHEGSRWSPPDREAQLQVREACAFNLGQPKSVVLKNAFRESLQRWPENENDSVKNGPLCFVLYKSSRSLTSSLVGLISPPIGDTMSGGECS